MTLPDFLKDDHSRFAFTGDEWLVSYAHLSASFVVVYPTTFSMAMVLELYLKAYAQFLHGSASSTTRFGHDIAGLYETLMAQDPLFPAALRLVPSLSHLRLFELDSDGWRSSWFLSLDEVSQAEIRAHYEIYLAMAYAADLKYGISPSLPKHGGRVISSAWSRLNPWLADFVVAIRKRIAHPRSAADDRLIWALRHPDLHPNASAFLRTIHERTFPSAAGA